MALRCARRMQASGISVRVLDLRWLKPLDLASVKRHASDCSTVLVFDEGRPEGGVSESIVAGLVEAGWAGKSIGRVTGRDCYIPLGDAARLVLASEEQLEQAARDLLKAREVGNSPAGA